VHARSVTHLATRNVTGALRNHANRSRCCSDSRTSLRSRKEENSERGETRSRLIAPLRFHARRRVRSRTSLLEGRAKRSVATFATNCKVSSARHTIRANLSSRFRASTSSLLIVLGKKEKKGLFPRADRLIKTVQTTAKEREREREREMSNRVCVATDASADFCPAIPIRSVMFSS